MEKVFFYYNNISFRLSRGKLIKSLIRELIAGEKKILKRVSYIFCSDEYLIEINRKFLRHNFYTDIITFPGDDVNFIEGEIYISIDRIRYNAIKLQIKFETELIRVMSHGILHLCGFNDKTKSQIQEMRNKEEEAIRLYSKMNV